ALTVVAATAQAPPAAPLPRGPVNAERRFSMAAVREQCIELTAVKQGTGAGDYRACAVSAFGELGVVDGETYYYATYCLIPSYETQKVECGDHSFIANGHSRRAAAVFARGASSEMARLVLESASTEIASAY